MDAPGKPDPFLQPFPGDQLTGRLFLRAIAHE
jgi:hypothetical protein